MSKWRRVFAVLLVFCFLMNSSLPALAVEESTETKTDEMIQEHLAKDDWSSIEKILENVYGKVTSPLAISQVSDSTYTQGQLMGNGDIGAVAASVSTSSQQYYFSKNDFWGKLHVQKNEVKDNDGILSGGGLDIGMNSKKGSQDAENFYSVQNLLNAEVVTRMQIKDIENEDALVQLTSWIADTDNVFVTEIENTGTNPVSMDAKLWVPAEAYKNNSATGLTDASETYPYDAGVDYLEGDIPVIWTTRDSCAGQTGNVSGFRARMGTAAIVLGAEVENVSEKRENNDYYDVLAKRYAESLGQESTFEVPAGGTVQVVCFFASSAGAYQTILQPEEVKNLAVEGVSEYLKEGAIETLKEEHADWWKEYWLKSYVTFDEADKDLIDYYYGSMYIQGCIDRMPSENGKVNPQNLPTGLYGVWFTADNMGWGGRYFLNYNQEAHYYAAGSTNHIEAILPYSRVIAYEEPWNINIAADQGFVGSSHTRTASAFHIMAGEQPALKAIANTKKWGFNQGSSDQKSNGVFAATPMLFYYYYTLDDDYLKDILYPHMKNLMDFYSDYVMKIDDGLGQYHYSVIGSSIHEGDAADINPSLDMGAIKLLADFLAKYAPVVGGIAQEEIERWEDLKEHTYYPEANLPAGSFDANRYDDLKPVILGADYMSPNQTHVDLIEPGDQPVELESVVFPFENEQVLDGDPEVLQKVINTLDYMNSWSVASFAGWSSQNNGFCKVYPIAARAGYDPKKLIENFEKAMNGKKRNTNLTYYQNGGAVETIGSMEFITSMALQSDTSPDMPSTIMVFPNWDKNRSFSYERLGAKGNIEVSSRYDSETDTIPYIDIISKRDGKIAVVNPWTEGNPVISTVNENNELAEIMEYAVEGGKIIFDAQENVRYMIINDGDEAAGYSTAIQLNQYSATLVYGSEGQDSITLEAELVGGDISDEIIWSAADPSLAEVDSNGNVKAKGTGSDVYAETVITASSKNDPAIQQSCKIKIADVTTVPSGIKMLNRDTALIYGPTGSTGDTTARVRGTNRLQLTVELQPENVYSKEIVWTSSDQKVAMVDKNGLVIARNSGTVTITGYAAANPELSVSCEVTVVKPAAEDYAADSLFLEVIQNGQKISEWSSMTTSSGGFTRKSNAENWESNQEALQKAFINALGVKNKYTKDKETVISKDTALFAAIALNNQIVKINPDLAVDLSETDKSTLAQAIRIAENFSAAHFYNSSNWENLVACLDRAREVYNTLGISQEEIDDACDLLYEAMTRADVSLQVGAVELNRTVLTLAPNEGVPFTMASAQLEAETFPLIALNKEIQWSSSNPVVAAVDETGNVTGIQPGTAIITAASTDNQDAFAQCIVVVPDIVASYECEDGTMYGSAAAKAKNGSNNANHSNDQVVGNVGANANSYVDLDVSAEEEGSYNVSLFYAQGTSDGRYPRNIGVSANGGEVYNLIAYADTNYNTSFKKSEVNPLTMTLQLRQGANQVRYSQSTVTRTYGPDLDKITISKADYLENAVSVTERSGAMISLKNTLVSGDRNLLLDGQINLTAVLYKDGEEADRLECTALSEVPSQGIGSPIVDETGWTFARDYQVDINKEFCEALGDGVYTLTFSAVTADKEYESTPVFLFDLDDEPEIPGITIGDLQKLYEEAELLQQDDYEVHYWNLFSQSKARAKKVLDQNEPTDQEISHAYHMLELIMHLMIEAKPDTSKDLLKIFLEQAQEAVDSGEVGAAIPAVQETFWEAFIEAGEVYKKADADGDEIFRAALKLLTELHKLGIVKGNKTMLNELYDMLDSLNLSDYKDGTAKDDFIKCMEDAKDILEDPNAIDSELEEAYQLLVEAAKGLEKKDIEVDKSNLWEMIQAGVICRNNRDKFVEARFDDFLEALNRAEQTYQNTGATQEEVDEALYNLVIAMAAIRYKADKSILESALFEVAGIETGKYTPESAAVFLNVLMQARDMMEDDSLSTDDEAYIMETAMMLLAAADALVPLSGTETEGTQESESNTESNTTEDTNNEEDTEESDTKKPGTKESDTNESDKNGNNRETRKGNKNQPGRNENAKGKNNVKTSDENMTAVIFIFLILSVGLLGGMSKRYKNNRK